MKTNKWAGGVLVKTLRKGIQKVTSGMGHKRVSHPEKDRLKSYGAVFILHYNAIFPFRLKVGSNPTQSTICGDGVTIARRYIGSGGLIPLIRSFFLLPLVFFLCSTTLACLCIVLAFHSTLYCESRLPDTFDTGAGGIYKITAYCSCEKCCGKYADGITASGYKVKQGYCAVNWMPFGTELEIEGLGTYKVMDRGAKSLFGDKNNHIKHIDIWFPTHKEAKEFGVKYKNVKFFLKKGNKNG